MAKIIYLKPEQEITSLIGYLWQTEEPDIVLIAPKNSSLLQNTIALKILKREADNCEKEVIFVVKGPKERENLEKTGFKTRPSWPKDESAELEEEIQKGPSEEEYESLLNHEVALRRRSAKSFWRINDIRPGAGKKFTKKEPTQEIKIEEESEDLLLKHLTPEGFEPEEESLEIPQEKESFKEKAEKFFKIQKTSFVKSDISNEANEEEILRPKFKRPHPRKKFFRPYFSFSVFSFKFLSVFVGAALIILGGVLFFVLPRAQVQIFPKTESFEQEYLLSAEKNSPNINEESQKIPAQLLKIEKNESKEFAATGKRQFNEKARGVISVFNEYSSSPQTLVATTRFVSEDGKVFRTIKTITVPGAKIEEGKIISSSINVEVVADQAGSDYNIGPKKFTIPGFKDTPKYASFYGRSKTAMTGGAVGEAKIVSQDDFDKAKGEIWKGLEASLDKEIKLQIPQGLKLLPEALKKEIVSAESSVGVGGRTEKFTLTLKGAATAMIFSEDDLKKLVEDNLIKDLGEGDKIKPYSIEINYQEIEPDFNQSLLKFKTAVTGKMVWEVNEQTVKNLIAGRSQSQIKQIFSQQEQIGRAQIILWPFWVKKVPVNPDKIKIILTID